MTQPNQPQYPNSGGHPAQNPGGYPGQAPGSGGFPAPGQPGGYPGQAPGSGGFPAQAPGGVPGQAPGSGGFPAQAPGSGGFQAPGSGGFPAPGPNSGGYPAQPYPQAPPAYPGGMMPPPKPSGGTAITAGVLAVLGAVWALISLIASFILLAEFAGSIPVMSYVGIGLVVVEALLLLVGGIMIFMKKPVGRWLVIAGCALVLISSLLTIVNTSMYVDGASGSGAVVGGAVGVVVIVALPAIITLVLAAVPPTGRYLQQAGAPQPQGW
ncbi:hypothetical protein [Amycolatopsis sp. 195334CR]|uniref:hypothetical protein n=1 Tax=Amycolatopsis sp. 195334CR TaxID=2814588 RepID=UPI001A8EC7A9|nr:hypothetical protein [Amycolatopsis sp. 195334CR]MBN6034606.1 hypothetical protein [Amycolatopsis sp. 195334CR]